MVQRYTRFENKPITGKSVLAVLVARKLGAANDPATPEAAKLENCKRTALKLLRKTCENQMSAFRIRRKKMIRTSEPPHYGE